MLVFQIVLVTTDFHNIEKKMKKKTTTMRRFSKIIFYVPYILCSKKETGTVIMVGNYDSFSFLG